MCSSSIVIVKALGVVSDIFFIHFEVFLVLDVLLAPETHRRSEIRLFVVF